MRQTPIVNAAATLRIRTVLQNLLTASLMIGSFAFAQDESCKLIPVDPNAPVLRPGLTPFWAQEYTGADLVRELIEATERATKTDFEPVPVAVIDDDFEVDSISGISSRFRNSDQFRAIPVAGTFPVNRHGTKAANIITAPAPIGTGIRVTLDAIVEAGDINHLYFGTREIQQTHPYFTNVSMGFGTFSPLTWRLKQIQDSTVLVLAAGNNFPEDIRERSAQLRGIHVSNINIWGWMEERSAEGPEVDIGAPADDKLLSWTQTGLTKFGGTSGAAPQVAGALANAAIFLGRLSVDESVRLLQFSAIPTLNSEQVPQLNGAGMLNAYKLAKVANRLQLSGWTALSHQERIAVLSDRKLYLFPEAEKLLIDGKAELLSIDCTTRKFGFRKVRESFLLADPLQNRETFHESARVLAAFYSSQGYSDNSTFFRSFDLREFQSLVEAYARSNDGRDRAQALRAEFMRNPVDISFLDRGLTDPYRKAHQTALLYAYRYGQTGSAALLKALEGLPFDLRLFRPGLESLIRSGENGRPILQRLLRNPNPEIRAVALEGVPYFGTPDELLLVGLSDPDPKVRRSAVSKAGALSPPNLRAIDDALKDPDPQIRLGAVWAISDLPPVDAAKRASFAITDKDKTVREVTASMVHLLDPAQAVELINAHINDDPDQNQPDIPGVPPLPPIEAPLKLNLLDSSVLLFLQDKSVKGLSTEVRGKLRASRAYANRRFIDLLIEEAGR